MSTSASMAAFDDGDSTCPEYPAGVSSLLGVLLYQMEHMPGRTVCHRIVRERSRVAAHPMTVTELLARASRAAAVLQARGVREGDRVLLSLADPHDFLVAFVGCLISGAAAVPLPTAGEAAAPRSFAARVRGVCKDCEPAAAVVENERRFSQTIEQMPEHMSVLEAGALCRLDSGPVVQPADRPGGQAAFLQYTSGSTGAPRGVVITHRNVLANTRAIRDATAYTSADRMVSWLPLHHDMGLVGGLLTSIYCAAETWLMPPMSFVMRPVTWLEAMTEFRATLTVAPTFAYGLCARKIPDRQLQGVDLSSLRLAYIGAEPIHPATLEAFTMRYARHGLGSTVMYPVYGLAEATLAVSFPAPGSAIRYDSVSRSELAAHARAVPAVRGDPDTVTFVSVGRALPRHRVRIVGRDSGMDLSEREVGELVFEGDSVAPRYFGEAAEARSSLYTGDLAYVAGGEIFIVDRIKDLIILAGQNHAPSDIEGVVADIPGLRRGRIVAFSLPGPTGDEQLHIVAEASAQEWRPPAEVVPDIAKALLAQIGLHAASISIVAPGSLERTSSGKIKRRACQDAFAAGTLRIVRTRADLGLRATDRLAAAARIVLAWAGSRLRRTRRTGTGGLQA